MNTKQAIPPVICKLAVAGTMFLAIAFTAAQAQVQTSTTSQAGTPTKTVKVERGQVVYVSGNNLVVKAEDGSLRDFNNVPDSATVTVDGKQLNVHQLQVGMTIERQTIVTTIPKRITTIKTVTGTVWHVNPPNSVILTLADGSNQQFKIPKGTTFNVNGKQTDAFGLKKGMKVDAQQVTEESETQVAKEVKTTGVMPPPPPAPAPDVPMLVVVMAPALPTVASEAAPTALPKTASDLPLIGLLGALFLALGLGLKAARTYGAMLR
jgi:RNase P/RNase MRP subunit p29